MAKAAVTAALALLLVALPAMPLHGRDNGQYAQVDPRIQQWFKSQKDRNGVSCCDTSDGTRLEDPDWECEDQDKCKVKLDDGKWYDVPPQAMVYGPGIGFAVVWRWFDPNAGWKIRCFQPGSRA